MQLKTLIAKLQKKRKEFIEEHGKEPMVIGVQDNWDESNFIIEVHAESKREGYVTTYTGSDEIKVRY